MSINIPFGPKHKIKPSKKRSCNTALSLSARAMQSVNRNEIIPVDHKRVRSKAIDPLTGNPYLIWFVDNTSHSAGTYESPFSTLLAAQQASGQNDIIYIFPGDQTTTGMAAGITLQDGQRLWGSAVAHSLLTSVGTIQIPAFSIGPFINDAFGTSIALLPIITVALGNVVTVANNNEISGIYIQNPAGNGINGASISNLTVLHSTIQGLSGESIALTDVGGTLLIDDNVISAGPMNSGINIGTTTSNLHATISNNQIVVGADACLWTLATQGTLQFTGNNVHSGSHVVNITQGADSNLLATVSNNQMQAFNSGLFLTAGGSNATVVFESNNIDAGGNAPAIEIDQTTGAMTAVVANNQIVNYGGGFFLNAGGSVANVRLQSNSIYPGGGNVNPLAAIEIDQTAGSLIATIIGNRAATGFQGVLINAGGSDATLSFQSNTFTSYFSDGIDIEQTAGTLVASLTNNNLSAQDNNGFSYANSIDPNASALLTVTNNVIDGYQPIFVHQLVGSVASILEGNLLTTNFVGPAATFTLDVASGTQTATLFNNTVTQSNGDGFDFFFYNMGSAVWNVTNNKFYGVGGNAARFTTNGTNPTTTVCVKFNDNIAYPIQVNGQGTYILDNTNNSGTFTLNPPTGNIGDFTTTGVVIGTCP